MLSNIRRAAAGTALGVSLALLGGIAAACPVSVLDAEHDLLSVSMQGAFSPVMTLRTDSVERAAAPSRMAATPCEGGFAGQYPCNNIDLLSFLPLSEIGGGSGNDIWGWTDPLTGNEYALMGRTSGTAFVDITDPVNPVYLGNLPTHTSNSSWRDLKVFADHVFVVSEAGSHGMQVFDLTQLRNVPNPPATFSNTAHYDGFGSAHNIVINEETGYAYGVGTSSCSGGLHMVDISNPTSPVSAGCYSADGYTHDAQCVVFRAESAHRFHHGSELCFNANEDTLTIVDVSDKSAPVQLARLPYSGSGYTHQGWLTEDHQYFLLDDELDETSNGHNTKTRVFDVSNPQAPALIGEYLSSGAAIDHNLYVKGSYAYLANYRAGLRILNTRNAASGQLTEEAYFDIYPSSDSASFNGAWSNYPYFESGNVIISGIEQGLFVVRPTSLVPFFAIEPQQDTVQVCGVGSVDTVLDVTNDPGFVDEVSLSLSGLPPAGVSGILDPPALTPPGDVTLSLDVTAPLEGQYRLNIDGVSGEILYSTTVNLEVSVAAPGQAQTLLPLDGATEVSSNQILYWGAVDGAYTYDVELASDPAFLSILDSVDGLTVTSYQPPALPENSVVYWRVTAHNACGGALSQTWSFTTATATCQLYESTDVPKAISSGAPNTATSVLLADAVGEVVDVNVVNLRGVHTYLGDLTFELEGPIMNEHADNSRHSQRARVAIIEEQCGTDENFFVSLDDAAPAGPLPCPYVDQSNVYQPNNSMSAFNGAPGTGDWTLSVVDGANQDGGNLTGWGLEICTTSAQAQLDSDLDGVADALDNCTNVANPDQRDTHGDGYGNLCDPDLDNNGTVDFRDLELLKAEFFNSGAGQDADLDGDEQVNFADLQIMKDFFFGPPGPSGVAME